MTEWIKDFSMQDIIKQGVALIGDKQERENSVEYILGSWDATDGPLVVLDADGALFAKHGGRGILVDLESANSALPDCLTPILAHRKYGRTPKLCAKLLGDILIREKQDRSSNDMFWTQSGRQTLLEYLEYSLLLAYQDKCNGAGTGNIMLDAAQAHPYLIKLMHDFVARGGDATERWQAEEIAVTPRRKPLEPLSERDKALKAELARQYGQGIIPFGDTLVSYAKNGSTTTPNCILKTALAMGRSIFEFEEKLSDGHSFYRTLQQVDLDAFVENDSDKKILFIVHGCDKEVSSLMGAMTLLGACAAADNTNRQLTCLVADIAEWNIFDGLSMLKSLFSKQLRLILGCADFMRASRRTDLPPVTFFDRLPDLTAQNIIWHKSSDVFLKQIFIERTSGQDLMYSLGDLGGNHMIAMEHSGKVEYAYMPDAAHIEHSPAAREERMEDFFDVSPLWFFTEPPAVEEKALCDGFDCDEDDNEDSDIFKKLLFSEETSGGA